MLVKPGPFYGDMTRALWGLFPFAVDDHDVIDGNVPSFAFMSQSSGLDFGVCEKSVSAIIAKGVMETCRGRKFQSFYSPRI